MTLRTVTAIHIMTYYSARVHAMPCNAMLYSCEVKWITSLCTVKPTIPTSSTGSVLRGV